MNKILLNAIKAIVLTSCIGETVYANTLEEYVIHFVPPAECFKNFSKPALHNGAIITNRKSMPNDLEIRDTKTDWKVYWTNIVPIEFNKIIGFSLGGCAGHNLNFDIRSSSTLWTVTKEDESNRKSEITFSINPGVVSEVTDGNGKKFYYYQNATLIPK